MKIKWPKIKFYSQKELINLKKSLAAQINNTEKTIFKALQENKVNEIIDHYEYFIKLTDDLKKVKRKIAKKNVLYGINSLIYGRERTTRELDLLITLKKTQSTKIFKNLKEKNLNIGVAITKLQNKFKQIKKSQDKKNSSLLLKSLLILKSQ